jgi:hypothetical protein
MQCGPTRAVHRQGVTDTHLAPPLHPLPPSLQTLSAEIASYLGLELGKIKIKRFADGEHYVQVQVSSVLGWVPCGGLRELHCSTSTAVLRTSRPWQQLWGQGSSRQPWGLAGGSCCCRPVAC